MELKRKRIQFQPPQVTTLSWSNLWSSHHSLRNSRSSWRRLPWLNFMQHRCLQFVHFFPRRARTCNSLVRRCLAKSAVSARDLRVRFRRHISGAESSESDPLKAWTAGSWWEELAFAHAESSSSSPSDSESSKIGLRVFMAGIALRHCVFQVSRDCWISEVVIVRTNQGL